MSAPEVTERQRRVAFERERCLTRIGIVLGKLPREAVSAVNDLVEAVERIATTPDDELEVTTVERRR